MNHLPRVAYFPDSYLEVNGVAHTSRQLVAFAAAHDRPFLCVHAGARTATTRISRQVSEVEVPRGRWSFGLDRDLRFDIGLWRHAPAIRRALEAFRPDVIHVTGPNDTGQLGAYLAHAMGVPLFASWHTNLHDFAAHRLDRVLHRAPSRLRSAVVESARRYALRLLLDFYRLATAQAAPNAELRTMLGRTGRGPVAPMERGVDTGLFRPRRHRDAGRAFRIGYVGRLTPEKNVRALADLDAQLRSRGLEYRIVIVGDGSERSWLATHLRRAEFAGVLTGEALARAYADMDLFVFPSRTDTYGNVVMEALASGTPAVVTSEGGPKFLVEDGVNGFVRDTPEQWADVVVALMQSPDRAAVMRRAARVRALAARWECVFERLYEAYGQALAAGPGRTAGASRHNLTIVARAIRSAFLLTTPRTAAAVRAPRAWST